MSREDRLFINDIVQACEKVGRYSAGVSRNQFIADDKTYDAVLRNLEIIGEAVKHLSVKFKEGHSQIEWRKIAGFRDMVVHEYFGLDTNILWDVVTNEVPRLQEQLRQINI